MFEGRLRFVWIGVFLIVIFIASCSPQSTPPGANSLYGGEDVARFSYHYWEEGLAILIWHDLPYGGEGCTGVGSTEDPVFRLACYIDSAEGQSFSWKAHTKDGITADLWIDDQSYDLSQGNMLLITTHNGTIEVEQYQRDFSDLAPKVETINNLSRTDPDVINFIDQIRTRSD